MVNLIFFMLAMFGVCLGIFSKDLILVIGAGVLVMSVKMDILRDEIVKSIGEVKRKI